MPSFTVEFPNQDGAPAPFTGETPPPAVNSDPLVEVPRQENPPAVEQNLTQANEIVVDTIPESTPPPAVNSDPLVEVPRQENPPAVEEKPTPTSDAINTIEQRPELPHTGINAREITVLGSLLFGAGAVIARFAKSRRPRR